MTWRLQIRILETAARHRLGLVEMSERLGGSRGVLLCALRGLRSKGLATQCGHRGIVRLTERGRELMEKPRSHRYTGRALIKRLEELGFRVVKDSHGWAASHVEHGIGVIASDPLGLYQLAIPPLCQAVNDRNAWILGEL